MSNPNSCQKHAAAIAALADGRMDSLTPDQMDAAAQHLDECTLCAGRLAGVSSALPLPSAVNVVMPPAEAWKPVWNAIQGMPAGQTAGGAQTSRFRPLRRTIQAISAMAAALLVGVALWQLVGRTDSAPLATLELAHAGDVEIDSLEASGDETSFVITAGADDVPIIWVVENTGA